MFDPTRGPARELIDRDELANLRTANAVVLDGRLSRPYYFDGRFLTAQDLTREQNYFLSRQADLGRAGGFGVVAGLGITMSTNARAIRIGAGHGITPLGEMVVLPRPIEVDLLDLPTMQRLNAAFGLATIPQEIARNRTGIFIVALRPVEYTANPIGAYPTSITAARTVEDSEIIEAVAVSLIPYQDSSTAEDAALRRSEIARRIFVEREARALPAGVLPLAMVALNRGIVDWIDSYLVLRSVGAEQQDILGLGYAPRALREAHVQQFNAQLSELVWAASGNGARLRFAAAERFRCLPPVGRLPVATIGADFTQIFFPPEVNVDLSFVPEDELPMLIEEALTLPPIDLTLRGDDQESTSVLIALPVTRATLHGFSERLRSNLTLALRPAAPGIVASRRPLDVLRGIRLPRPPQTELDAAAAEDSPWVTALATAPATLWFVRRRNLNFVSSVVGLTIDLEPQNPESPVEPPIEPQPDEPPVEPPVEPDPPQVPDVLNERLRGFGSLRLFTTVFKRSAHDAQLALIQLLLMRRVAAAEVFTEAALTDLSLEPEGEIGADAVASISRRFGRTDLGDGLALLVKIEPGFKRPELVDNMTLSGVAPEIDGLGRLLLQLQKQLDPGPLRVNAQFNQISTALAQALGTALTAHGTSPRADDLTQHRAAMAEFVTQAAQELQAQIREGRR